MLLPEPGNQTRASAKPPTGSAYPPGVDPPHGVSVPPLQTAAPLEELDNCRLRSPSLCQTLDGESETPFTWPPLPTAHSLVFTEFPLNSSSKAIVQLPGAPSGWVPVPVLVLGLLVLGVGVGVGVMLGLGLTLWLRPGRGAGVGVGGVPGHGGGPWARAGAGAAAGARAGADVRPGPDGRPLLAPAAIAVLDLQPRPAAGTPA